MAAATRAVLAPGTVVVEKSTTGCDRRYTIGGVLGKGGFAVCYEMTSMDSFKTFAGKVIAKASLVNATAKSKLINEIRIHRNLNHVGIVKFHHFFEDTDHVYILLERCRHQTFVEMLKARGRLTQPEVQFFVLQIIDVLEYLREEKVIHRDVKLGNLFLHDDLRVKMGDFGLAAKVLSESERKTTICGTPNYIAPEILDSHDGGHSFEVDVWALGVLIYTILIGKPPYETTNIKETYARIRSNEYEYPSNIAISAPAKDLIGKLLVLRPERRATLNEIRFHPFFTFSRAPLSIPLSALTMNPFEEERSLIAPTTVDKENIAMPKMTANQAAYAAGLRQEFATVGRLIDESFTKKPDAIAPALLQWTGCVTIVKTLNYSAKYGIGYLMSTAAIGIYFNDGTKLALNPSATAFAYYTRHSDRGEVHPFTIAPVGDSAAHPLEKKITLLRHFRKHLLEDGAHLVARSALQRHDDNSPVFVRKWVGSKRSLLFSLSTGTVQVLFADKSELVIDPNRIVRFTDKLGVHHLCNLDRGCLDPSRGDFRRRLDYTKDMIQSMSQ